MSVSLHTNSHVYGIDMNLIERLCIYIQSIFLTIKLAFYCEA